MGSRSHTVQRARRGTYSIAARDPSTGELGVAVQSHWFSVGPIVPWARPGVGAIATQASVEISYGPHGLDLLAGGLAPRQALETLIAADEFAAGRQVAIVDAQGRAAAYTGEGCMSFAGHVTGEGVSCQANIMASDAVWPAMLETFASETGSLTSRLLAALDAAEREGGDLRGRQSAAILVVPARGEAWESVVSLRVEDDPEPLAELRRLVRIHDAYELASRGDELINEGRQAEAAGLYEQASELAPENLELRFWAGLGLAQQGEVAAGLEHIKAVVAVHPQWRELLERLPPELAPSAPAVLAALRAES